MIIAGAGDLLSLRIPNWLTLLIAASFFPMAFATGMPLAGIGEHALIGFGLLMAGFALFSFGLFGGGDAKLLAAAGLWFGTSQTLPFIIFTMLVGGALAFAVGIWSIVAMSWEIHDMPFWSRVTSIKPNVPYGYALAVAAILVFPDSWWMLSAA
jgi:prepilin peptidase CpaA